MKKELFEIFICMLMVAMVIPAASMTTNWTEKQKLLISEGTEGDLFGCSVSLTDDTALIGAKLDDDKGVSSGSAYVFTRNGTTWTQQAKLTSLDGAAGDQFGYSVSLDGDTALIGTHDDKNRNKSGSVYVFIRNGTNWTQQAKLLASDATTNDYFGSSITLAGDTALIGACFDNDNGNYSGSAYVFIRTGTTWTQQAKLLASDGAQNDNFGFSVSLSGDNAIIGAPWDDDNADASGSAYLFTRTDTTWT